ncbi:GSCOCG00010758001-RA-CDS [Cotesia congregata]|nr:GSCOCG00010758001-RA-CDS [Cotesia congregata]
MVHLLRYICSGITWIAMKNIPARIAAWTLCQIK